MSKIYAATAPMSACFAIALITIVTSDFIEERRCSERLDVHACHQEWVATPNNNRANVPTVAPAPVEAKPEQITLLPPPVFKGE